MSENPYRAKLMDFVASSGVLTENFTDDEAIPLMKWAEQQAERVGVLIASDAAYEEMMGIFSKWIRTVFVMIERRGEADAEWLDKMIARVNEFAPVLHAATISPEQRDVLLSNSELETASYRDLLLPMVVMPEAPDQPAVVEMVQSVLGQVTDLIGQTLPDETIRPSVQPDQAENPLATYHKIDEQPSHTPTDESETPSIR